MKKLRWSASSAWFSLHWGWRCTTPLELLNVGPGDVPKHALLDFGRGVHAFFCTVFGWQCVENHEGLVKECGFHCIGAGGVPAPMSCHTLGRAMHQNAHWLTLPEACMGVFVSFIDGTVCKKDSDELVKERGFVCIGVDGAPPPNALPKAGPGDAPKAMSLGFSGGVHGCIHVVSGL